MNQCYLLGLSNFKADHIGYTVEKARDNMKESEAKGFIQGKLNCMKKCGVFNKEDNINYNDCDYCNYCYSQGNFGQQKEAFNMAINALEKQEKIKDLLDSCTAYPDDMCDCLVEIEKILRSDEE